MSQDRSGTPATYGAAADLLSAGSLSNDRRAFLQASGSALAAGLVSSLWAQSAAADVPSITAAEARRLQARVRGTVVLRGTPTYEVWRQSMIWNYRKFRRYPDLIVQADCDDDVVEAVKFAHRSGIRLVSRGGGHSWSGSYLRDGGMLMDLSRLQAMEVDPRAHAARVQPGVLGRILNARLADAGLAFPTAHCGMVPVSGFLLGGGLGLNSVAWGGMSVFNIRALDIVTAQGERLHASASQNEEYFWAARGAGPGLFCIVTCFYLECYPLPRAITTDTYFLPFSELPLLAQAMDHLGPECDPNVELLSVVIPTPSNLASRCSDADHGRVAVLAATAFADSPGQAVQMLSPVADHPLLRKAMFKIARRPTPFEVLYQDNEGPFPQRRARADNIYTNHVSDAAAILMRHMPAAPSPGNTPVILWRGTKPFPDAAYSASGRFYFATYAQWDHRENDFANELWLRALYDDMQPVASGHYINEFDQETRGRMTRNCFAPANWRRLQELRRKLDPQGVFLGFMGADA